MLNDTTRSMIKRRANSGFALVLVLLVLAIVAGLGLTLLGVAGGGDRASVAALSDARERAAARAAFARIVHLSRRDVTRERVPLDFAIDGMDVDAAIEPESGKVDLNIGDQELLRAALRRAGMDDAVEAIFEDSLNTHRFDRRAMASVETGLRPCDRIGSLGQRLARIFTVMTRVHGIDPRLADPALVASLPQLQAGDIAIIAALKASGGSLLDEPRLAHLRGLISGSSSSVTIRAIVQGAGTAGTEYRIAVVHELGRSVPRIAATSNAAVGSVSLCDLIH